MKEKAWLKESWLRFNTSTMSRRLREPIAVWHRGARL